MIHLPHGTIPAPAAAAAPAVSAAGAARTVPEPWTNDPYAHALITGRGPLYLRRMGYDGAQPADAGQEALLPLDVERWCAAPDAADTALLRRCHGHGPVLDIGCGPGRLVTLLTAQRRPALGVDLSPAAVARTRRSGGAALRRSVFDRLPGEGRWGTALLVDGNIGIGGDPHTLLERVRQLVAPAGRLLVEADSHDLDERLTVRVEDAHGRHSRHFRWARLGTPALLRAADAAGWTPAARWSVGTRHFVELHRPAWEQDRFPRLPAPRSAGRAP
jgi:SAM-dependent methyltransferase